MSAVVNGNMTKMFEAVHYHKAPHTLSVYVLLSIKGKLSDRVKKIKELMIRDVRFVYSLSGHCT